LYDVGAAVPKRPARNTFLVFNGLTYPGKFIRGLAYRLATGIDLNPNRDYSGGMETVRFFDGLGLTARDGASELSERGSSHATSPPAVLAPASASSTVNAGRGSDRSDLWVATVLAHEPDGEESFNDDRLNSLVVAINKVNANRAGAGIILFPAGWFSAGADEPKVLFPWLEAEVCRVLAAEGYPGIVCVGVDGRGMRDQIGVALNAQGIVAVARKFHPTADEQGWLATADDPWRHEDSKPRTFTLGNYRFYMCVCYDIFGIPQRGLNNPGVDAVLDLVHRFRPRGSGQSGDVDFARKGLAGASSQWACPVFAAVVFQGRPVPAKWPSGVLRVPTDQSVRTWRYDQNLIQPSAVLTAAPGLIVKIYAIRGSGRSAV
jgi:hypothetical protein